MYKYLFLTTRGKIVFVSVLFSVYFVALCLFMENAAAESSFLYEEIKSVSARSNDGAIDIIWDRPEARGYSGTELVISGVNSDYIYSESLDKNINTYHFTGGKHGDLYNIELYAKYSDGNMAESITKQQMFLNYDSLPDLPIVNIETADGQEPPFEMAVPPIEGTIGGTIVKHFVKASMSVKSGGSTELNTSVKIRVRGNTSAYEEKKPYKIKFESAVDLLNRDDDRFKSTEWLLLASGDSFNTVTGKAAAEVCGSEWQPDLRFVNVMVNGDWKGMYMIVEAVDASCEGRCKISKEGYLIENDPYYWNEDVYFDTDYKGMFEFKNWTFKYPKTEDLSQERVDNIQSFVNDFEKCLFTGDTRYSEYIDIDSWAGWLLTHDMLGMSDSVGSNQYLYKYDFDMDNPTSTKLKMGPSWDFDSLYAIGQEWSSIHLDGHFFYFPELFNFNDFRKLYKLKYYDVRKDFIDEINAMYDDICLEYGVDNLNESRELNGVRWGKDSQSVREEINQVNSFLDSRLRWIDNNIDYI